MVELRFGRLLAQKSCPPSGRPVGPEGERGNPSSSMSGQAGGAPARPTWLMVLNRTSPGPYRGAARQKLCPIGQLGLLQGAALKDVPYPTPYPIYTGPHMPSGRKSQKKYNFTPTVIL